MAKTICMVCDKLYLYQYDYCPHCGSKGGLPPSLLRKIGEFVRRVGERIRDTAIRRQVRKRSTFEDL